MIVTEEEAKDKLCPMSFNHVDATLKCYGSKCMWWQPSRMWVSWQSSEAIPPRRFENAPLYDLVAEPERPESVPRSWEWMPYDEADPYPRAGWIEPREEAEKRRKGYCGMCPPSE